MCIIRLVEEGELPELERQYGDLWVALEDDVIVGHVLASIIHGLGWITDLKVWSKDPMITAKLCSKARKSIKDWGFDNYYLNIDPNHPDMFDTFIKTGHKVVQIVMKKEISHE